MAFAQRYAGANGGVTAGLAAPSSSAAASLSPSLRKPFHAPHAGSLTLGGPLNATKLGAAHPNARPITRSSIWFADGNVVLVARRTAFRVHRGQLARHSDVFRDLFMVPQPPPRGEGLHRGAGEESWDGEGTIDGCAAVELHDAPADVTCLLKALYDGLYLEPPNARHFPTLAAILRLSTKYLIDHLRAQCIAYLSADWPTTLAGWDKREKEAVDKQGRYAPREACAHPILVIGLAREMGITEWLPAAFYDLARYGPRRIVSGAEAPFLELYTDHADGTDPKDKKTVYLGRTDLHTILLGREAGQRFLSSFIAAELSARPPCAACANAGTDSGRACRDSVYYVHLNVLRAVGGITHGRDADALFTLSQVVEMLGRTDFTDGVRRCGLRICCACRRELEECVQKAREHVWNLVPGWFALEDEARAVKLGDAVNGERRMEA